MYVTGYKPGHLYHLSQVEQENQGIPQNRLVDRILIIGSGILECQTAVKLAEQGKEVFIVEYSDELLPDCVNSPMRVELMRRLEKLVVTFYLATSIHHIEKNQVFLREQEGFEVQLTIDGIILPKNYEFF